MSLSGHPYTISAIAQTGELVMGLNGKEEATQQIQQLSEWLRDRVNAFTLRHGFGFWEGREEEVVSILIGGLDLKDLERLGCSLALAYNQKSIGLLWENSYLRIQPAQV